MRLEAVEPQPSRPGEPRAFSGKHLCASAGFLGLLFLSKFIFVLIPPLFAVLLILQMSGWRWERRPPLGAVGRATGRVIVWFALPCALFLGVLLWSNSVRFGSPFNTGYLQQAGLKPFGGNWVNGLRGYLIDPQFSVLVMFPVLVFSLPCWPRFFRRYRLDAALYLVLCALFLAMYTTNDSPTTLGGWRGEWSVRAALHAARSRRA